jgi:hypothetical protein
MIYKVTLLVTILCTIAQAQMPQSDSLSIYFDFPVNTEGFLKSDSMEIRQFNKLTGNDVLLGKSKVSQYGLPPFTCEYILEDWLHNRLLFIPGYRTAPIQWYIMDLQDFSISRPHSDTLMNFNGDLYLSPDGKYLIGFYEDIDSAKTLWTDSLILKTYIFNADNYSLYKRIEGMAAMGGIVFPTHYWTTDASAMFIVNPYCHFDDFGLLKYSIPDFELINDFSLKKYCNFQRGVVKDIKDTLLLAYFVCQADFKTTASYKLINLKTAELINEITKNDTLNFKTCKISPDGSMIYFQNNAGTIYAYDNRLELKWISHDSITRYLKYAAFRDQSIYIKSRDRGIINRFNAVTGELVEQIRVNKVGQ